MFDGDLRDKNDDSRLGAARGLLWAEILVLSMAVGMGLGVCWGIAYAAPPLADHQACAPTPALQFPRRVLLYQLNSSDYAQSQLAMARINMHDTRRDWVAQVPLGQSFDILVMPGASTWVQWYCGQGSNQALVWVGTNVPWSVWAEHELVHAIFYMGDHIRSYLWPALGWINPRYCDPPMQNSPYQGLLSYCVYPPTWNAWDDEWLDRLYP